MRCGESYGCHEETEETAHAKAHDAGHDGLSCARVHRFLCLKTICQSRVPMRPFSKGVLTALTPGSAPPPIAATGDGAAPPKFIVREWLEVGGKSDGRCSVSMAVF